MTPTTKFLLAYAGYVAGIHLVDGPWRNWSRGRAVDAWSLTHIAWGMIARRIQVPYRTFMLLGVGNEAFELYLRSYHKNLLWGEPESMANVAADIAFNHIGYKVAS